MSNAQTFFDGKCSRMVTRLDNSQRGSDRPVLEDWLLLRKVYNNFHDHGKEWRTGLSTVGRRYCFSDWDELHDEDGLEYLANVVYGLAVTEYLNAKLRRKK